MSGEERRERERGEERREGERGERREGGRIKQIAVSSSRTSVGVRVHVCMDYHNDFHSTFTHRVHEFDSHSS